MDTIRQKYPRTFHLPWSPGRTDDDKVLSSTDHFIGKEVVVTEKMDGENTTIYPDGTCHARSLDSRHHASRSLVKQLAAEIGPQMSDDWRICGENLYARHSIGYDRLPGFFLVFGIYEEHMCLSWDDTVGYAAALGLPTVPVLYRGGWDEDAIRACWDGTSAHGDVGEGYVVRNTSRFPLWHFSLAVAKYVRASHVQTDQHWMSQPVVPNKLEV